MNNAAKTIALGTTPSGKKIHWFVGGYPLCGQHRGLRGNGRFRTTYGADKPTCPHCAQYSREAAASIQ